MQKSRYKVLKRENLTAQTFLLHTERPEVMVKAGQCFSIGTKELGVNREYSIYSGADESYLSFLIRKLDDGVVSPILANCQADEYVEIGGPYGEFCLQKEHTAGLPLVFIASGTGIAPFHSFVKTYPQIDYQIIHGVRFNDETYQANHYVSERYIACISKPIDNSAPMRVTDYLRNNPVNPNAIYYLCGNRTMITDVILILRSKMVPGDRIFTETFF